MSFSNEVVTRIKESIEIVDLIGDYLTLKKVGKNYVTNCPFHKDDTPSFYVSPHLNVFHCFGCGKSGDVISFIMEFEKVPFVEALKILGEKTGIKIEKFEGENEILYSIHEFAANLYHKELLKSKPVLEYLKKRGIKEDIIEEFKLGFAPPGNFFLSNAKKEFKIQDLLKSGLIKKSLEEIKDTFFLRLLFPIFSSSGRIIGFGGRRLSKNGPKYLNSPDTPIHKKGKNLYSLWHTKEEIRKLEKVILVEGYFDFLSLYQSGFKNTVACLGTSLTMDQAELLSRYAKEIFLFFDEDIAGEAATLRSLGMLLGEGCNVRIGKIEKKDPAELIVKEGKEAFEKAIKESTDFIEWLLEKVRTKYQLTSPFELSKAIEEINNFLQSIRDRTKQEIYKDFLSKKLAISKEMFGINKEVSRKSTSIKKINISEREELELLLIYSLLENPKEKDKVLSIIDEEYIKNPHLKKYFRLIKEGIEVKIKDTIESLPQPFIDYLIKKSEFPSPSPISQALGLKKYHLEELIEQKLLELQKLKEGDEKETLLCEEIAKLTEEREAIKKEG
ncbi:MAG: DNA primase [candidate division WOR-3 bacterium]